MPPSTSPAAPVEKSKKALNVPTTDARCCSGTPRSVEQQHGGVQERRADRDDHGTDDEPDCGRPRRDDRRARARSRRWRCSRRGSGPSTSGRRAPMMRTPSTMIPYTRNTRPTSSIPTSGPYSGRKMLNPVMPISVAARMMPGRMAAGAINGPRSACSRGVCVSFVSERDQRGRRARSAPATNQTRS